MFGSRPAATAEKITSRDAPSNIRSRIRESDSNASRTTAGVVGRAGNGACRPGPRATIGAASENTIVSDSAAALTRPPRRPRCARPSPRKRTAATVTRAAPTNIRSRVIGSRTSPKPRQFSHISADAALAAMVQSHDNNRTLSQPGDSTSTARIWRKTIKA